MSNFLDFAHVHTPHRKEIEVDEFMRRTIDGLPLHKFEKVRLKLRNDDPHARHLMDASLLSQALTNIILNALEVSPENGEVEVGSRMEDGLLRIWVRDEGPGMDEVTRKKIFQPFFTTKTSGSGLGLAIVHKIIESQNGRVECFSAPGEGSTFYIVM
ncbi:MAG: sensor histidine kinase [Spirochaetota bacterium]|nr:sensor histidine kinase [Spirochaetota bacterium]